MSVLPLLLSSIGEQLEQLEQQGVSPKGVQMYCLRQPQIGPRCPMAYYRPWNELMRKGDGGSSTVKADKEKFHVDLDVQHFAPEEISVKVADRFVIVEGNHEEKEDDHGWVSRQFMRKYLIPEQCDIDQVSSKLSSDGILSIIVPRKQKSEPENERVIQVEYTSKPAVSENQKEESA